MMRGWTGHQAVFVWLLWESDVRWFDARAPDVRRDADMTIEFLASLHDAKRLRTLLADGKRPACQKYVSLVSD